MKTAQANSRSLYWILMILGIVVGVVVYGPLQLDLDLTFLIFFSGVPFFLFVIGIYGLLWPLIKPKGEEIYITHALMMGLLFIILFFIHVWVLLPRICPEFGSCLGI